MRRWGNEGEVLQCMLAWNSLEPILDLSSCVFEYYSLVTPPNWAMESKGPLGNAMRGRTNVVFTTSAPILHMCVWGSRSP